MPSSSSSIKISSIITDSDEWGRSIGTKTGAGLFGGGGGFSFDVLSCKKYREIKKGYKDKVVLVVPAAVLTTAAL